MKRFLTGLCMLTSALCLGCPEKIPQRPVPPDAYLARPAGSFLYVLVPSLNEVVRIDPANLVKSVIPVGTYPITMNVSGDGQRLIVLNVTSSTVSVIDARSGSVREVPVRKGANAISVSQSGRYAIAYLDLSLAGFVPVEGVLNLNEITLVDTVSGDAVSIALGFDPSIAGFTPSETATVVLSRSQVALIDNTPPFNKVSVPLVADPSQPVTPARMAVTEERAFVAVKESGDIYAVDIQSPSVNIVTVAGSPYLFEIARNGEYLLAAPPGKTNVILIRTSDLWMQSIDLGEVYDSGVVSPDGTLALFFKKGGTIASVLDLVGGTSVKYSFPKGVDKAGIAGDGKTALIIHTPGVTRSYLQYSVSIIDIAGRTVHPIALQSAPTDFLIYDPGLALVSEKDAGGIAVLDLKEKVGSWVPTPSLPSALGSIGQQRTAYVIHDQPLGRATFIEIPSLNTRSVDGIFTSRIYDR